MTTYQTMIESECQTDDITEEQMINISNNDSFAIVIRRYDSVMY